MSKTGLIYKLVCNDIDVKECYVGSTINLTRRKCHHKHRCNDKNNKAYHLYVYQFIRENGGFENWDMIQVEQYNFNTRNELHSKERYWVEQLQATLNSCIPARTGEEYRKQNRAKINERMKIYNKNNSQIINEKHKRYYENNKQQLSGKNKKYYENNRDTINESRRQLMDCECGATVKKSYLLRHQRESKKHIFYEKFREYIHN
jgi:exonuclease VII large subunit